MPRWSKPPAGGECEGCGHALWHPKTNPRGRIPYSNEDGTVLCAECILKGAAEINSDGQWWLEVGEYS